MAKRGRVKCSRKACKFRDKKGSSIDMLPDELLVLILSTLPLKEAVATSILSRRWRYLWTFITKLDFDGTFSMLKMMASGKRRSLVDNEKARLNCVEWVNHVIALHKSPNIEEFRVFFDLTMSYKSSIDECSIDEWLRFALARKVERLELNLTAAESYTFDPYNLLKRKFSDSIDHVKYLKKIFLNHVYVNDKALEFFLRRCPLLEHLSVSQSKGLSSLKIIRPFPSFKRLEINWCYNLKSIEIRDANLVYLKYRGYKVHFVVENLPQLVEMYIGGRCGGRGMEWDVGNVFLLFSNYIPQLEILTLDFFWGYDYDKLESLCSDVKMSNLKQLIVKVVIVGVDSLMPLANLVHASPCTETFVLVHSLPRLKRYVHKVAEWPLFIERTSRKTERSYPQLKEIEFVGYQGMVSELELFEHFLDNAVALDKIRVDTFKTNGLWFSDDIHFAAYMSKVNEAEISARSRAKKQLSMKVPPKINLEII